MIALILLLAFALVVFAVGRLVCPPHDRLPLRCLDRVIAVTTWARGWRAIASAGPLSTLRTGDGAPVTGTATLPGATADTDRSGPCADGPWPDGPSADGPGADEPNADGPYPDGTDG